MVGLENLSLVSEAQRAAQAAQNVSNGQTALTSLSAEFNAEIEAAKAAHAASNTAPLAETSTQTTEISANAPSGSANLSDAAYRGEAGFNNRYLILAGQPAQQLEPSGQGSTPGQTGQTGPSKGPAKIIPFPNQGTPVKSPPSKSLTDMTRQRGLLRSGARGAAFMVGIQYLRQHGLETLMREDVSDLKSETGITLDVDHNPYHRAIAEEYTENLGDSKLGRLYRGMPADEAKQIVQYRLNELAAMQAEGGEKTDPASKPDVSPQTEAQPAAEPDKLSRFCKVEGTPPANDLEKKFVEDVRNEALKRMDTLSNDKRGPVLTGVLDPQTPGRVFYGMNHPKQMPPANLHPVLQKRLDALNKAKEDGTFKPSERCGEPGYHSEIYALDEALKAREARLGRPATEADLSEMLLHNRSLYRKWNGDLVPPRCDNCNVLTDGVKVISGE
jgi:hypothetical protein